MNVEWSEQMDQIYDAAAIVLVFVWRFGIGMWRGDNDYVCVCSINMCFLFGIFFCTE